MKNNYILIDYENVQPKNLAVLNDHAFKVIVFVGANQAKLPFEVASSLQVLGDKAEYVKISGNGSNTLDFHIAFYIGQFSERDPNAYFHIISKDTGFDPLIKHLKQKKILIGREKDLADIRLLRIVNAVSLDEKLNIIVENFSMRCHSLPRKEKKLANTISSLFMKTLEDTELISLIKEMIRRKYIVVENSSVSYRPPIIQ